MILTCPECATRYFIDDERVGSGGRTVRCSSCAASWKAEPGADNPLELSPAAVKKAAKAEKVKATPPTSGPLHRSFRDQVHAKRKTREAMAAGVVWAVLAAGFALVVLGAVIFRVQVVKLWPATAGAYAFARMPVNPTGFAIEGVQGGPALTEGRLAIVASGMLRNEQDEARAAPPVRVSLYDNGGRRLVSKVVTPPDEQVAPGDARAFKASFVDPPSASHLQVEFAFDVHRPKVSPGRQHGARAPLSGASLAARIPAPVAARPLPANSPYALAPVPHG